MSRDVRASVRARLLNLAKAQGEEFERTLVRYARERLLFRLGKLPARDRCVLKGACLLAVWMKDPYRATREVDFLSFGSMLQRAVAACFERRRTPLQPDLPRVLTPAFHQIPELQTGWRRYLAAGSVWVAPPAQFEVIGDGIIGLLGPVRAGIAEVGFCSRDWPPGGPWR